MLAFSPLQKCDLLTSVIFTMTKNQKRISLLPNLYYSISAKVRTENNFFRDYLLLWKIWKKLQ